MQGPQILHTLFSFLPFTVCLFWFICFMVGHRKNDPPKRYLTVYLLTCTVLYLCHGVYFTLGLPHVVECLWTLCSLSAYPLFYGYLCRLTSSDYSVRQLLPLLAPGALVAAAKYAYPHAGIDRIRLLLFTLQIALVVYCGIRKLKAFDQKLQSVYADTEERDTAAVHHLLIVIIAVSVLAAVANSIGKQFFGESLWLLIAISLAFSVMLFALSYVGFVRNFTIDTLNLDTKEEAIAADNEQAPEGASEDDGEQIGKRIERLMVEEHYFLKKDLKIGDLVRAVGSNRTYVSSYINMTYNCSFSDYMNRLRVEYAEGLLLTMPKGTKLAQIAADSGFAGEQSFYRNFKKFTGTTPAEWLGAQRKG